jgi:hypothetical protein
MPVERPIDKTVSSDSKKEMVMGIRPTRKMEATGGYGSQFCSRQLTKDVLSAEMGWQNKAA